MTVFLFIKTVPIIVIVDMKHFLKNYMFHIHDDNYTCDYRQDDKYN